MKENKFVWILILLFGIAALAAAQAEIGDANESGSIDIIDALAVANFTVGRAPLAFNADAADVDGSETVNIVDALIIAQYYVGIINKFPRPMRTRTPQSSPIKTPVLTGYDYQAVIQAWAREQGINLTGYIITRVNSPAINYMLPGYVFFSLIIRQYPVAYGPPDKQLGISSLVAIDKREQVALIQNEIALQEFYREHQTAVPRYNDTTGPYQAIKAWLGLSQEFKNDGFYTFVIPDELIIITPLTGDVVEYRVEGTSQVATGGEGLIKAVLTIDFMGYLVYADEKYELIPGIRPICQSTKLLDKDPIVRRMAEQDLLTMGRKAEGYLISQRAKAAPKLKKAIDAVWQKILQQEEKRAKIYSLMTN